MNNKKTMQEKLEEMKKEHPLITDKRCFTLSWFPETVPAVLKEEEELLHQVGETE